MKAKNIVINLTLLIFIIISLQACKKKEENNTVEEVFSDMTIEQADEEASVQAQEKLFTMDLEAEELESEKEEETAYIKLGYEVKESGEGFSLSTLKKQLNEGSLSEQEYHCAVVSLAYDPSFFKEEYATELIAESYDPSSSLQWMIDHQKELDEREKAMLQKA
ncbi:MAG: hypothetical protein JW708_03155, partial [Vallitaleaceae bacterium]|nr:hypothetical protein [Vallitaleaceae bacterium]